MRFYKQVVLVPLVVLVALLGSAAAGCAPVGGGIITDMGVPEAGSTLGLATGDLKGAVGVHVLGQASGPNNTVLITVQHFWVTDSGDIIHVNQAQLTGTFVAPGLLAVISYPITISSGGTGKFQSASGSLRGIGEADFNTGQLVLRYRGTLCYPGF